MGFTIDQASLQRISVFEKITHAGIKDTFEDDHGTFVFVVNPGQKWKALGPKASNIKKLEQRFNAKVRVIEFAEQLNDFVRNVVYPNSCTVKVDEDVVVLVPHDMKVRGQLIGRAANRLRNTEKIVQRYFPIKRMQVTQVQETGE